MQFLRTFIIILTIVGSFAKASAQVNADQVTAIGRNVLSMEDYVLAIQYFNLAIKAKPYLSDPYFFRGLAKLNLEDYKGAEEDCSLAIERNKFKTEAYKLRGYARQQLGKDSLALEDFNAGLQYAPLDKYLLYYKAAVQTDIKDFESADSTFSSLLRAYPRFEEGYMMRARAHLLQGDTLAALQDVDKSLDLSKNLVNSYLLRASIESDRKNWDKALNDLNEAIKLAPKETDLYINRAFVKYNSDDYKGAMDDYNYALELEPYSKAAIFNRGLLRYEVKDLTRAASDFSKVLEIEPDNVHALYNRGLVNLEQKNYKAALSDFEATARKFKKFYPVYYAIAECYRGMGDTRRAILNAHHAEDLVKRYVTDPEDNPLDRPTIAQGKSNSKGTAASGNDEDDEIEVMNRFNRLVTVGQEEESRLAYNEKIKGRLQDRDIRVSPEPSYAVSLENNSNMLQATRNYFKELDDFNSRRYLDIPVYLSPVKDSSSEDTFERWNKEVDSFSRIINSGRARPADYLGRGLAYSTIKNFGAAEADFNKALETGSEAFTLAYMARGYARQALGEIEIATAGEKTESGIDRTLKTRLASARMAEAIADYDKAIELNPRLIYAWFNKGNILLAARDLSAALECFSKAIEINPDFGQAYFNRALIYLQLGNRRLAFSDLSKAGELGVLPSYNLLKRMK